MCWNDNRKSGTHFRVHLCWGIDNKTSEIIFIWIGTSRFFLYANSDACISRVKSDAPTKFVLHEKFNFMRLVYYVYIYMFSCDKLYRFSRSMGAVGRWTHCCWKLPLVSIKTIQKPCQHRKPMGLTPSVILRGHVCGLFYSWWPFSCVYITFKIELTCTGCWPWKSA